MVKYIVKEGIEYAIIDKPTVSDPVGKYLIERLQDGRQKKTGIGKKYVNFSEAVDLLEQGNMPRTIYENLLKRLDLSWFGDAIENRKKRRILNEAQDLTTKFFGEDLSGLKPEEREKLTEAATSTDDLKAFLTPYLERGLENIPKFLESHKEDIKLWIKTNKRGSLKEIDKILGRLEYVVNDLIHTLNRYNPYSVTPDFRKLYLEYCDLSKKAGKVFEKAGYLNKMEQYVEEQKMNQQP